MKFDESVKQVQQDAVVLLSKATVSILFIYTNNNNIKSYYIWYLFYFVFFFRKSL